MTGVEMQSIRERALSLLADGRASEAIELLMEIIALVDRDKDALAARLLAQLRHRFGAKSEKAPVEQLLLALAQLGADAPASTIAEEPPRPAWLPVKPPSRRDHRADRAARSPAQRLAPGDEGHCRACVGSCLCRMRPPTETAGIHERAG
jgi:hypothetical protein